MIPSDFVLRFGLKCRSLQMCVGAPSLLVGACGSLWEPLGTSESLWEHLLESLGASGSLWEPFGAFGNHLEPLGVSGSSITYCEHLRGCTLADSEPAGMVSSFPLFTK
jgi:hypothetical protein